jgi:hypothetical protein
MEFQGLLSSEKLSDLDLQRFCFEAFFFFLISNGNFIKKCKGEQPLYTGNIQESP